MQIPPPNELTSHESPSCDSQSHTLESPSQQSHTEERPESPLHESHSSTPSPHSPAMNEDCDVYVSIIVKVFIFIYYYFYSFKGSSLFEQTVRILQPSETYFYTTTASC